MSKTHHHDGYYVPDYSAWPIISVIGLFCFALGSLNLESLWGTVLFALGGLVLLITLFGWFGAVVREGRSGFYNQQMGRTFRWGMFWFIFMETALFGCLIGTAIYVRVGILPWLAGEGSGGSLLTHYLLWPNFQATWPLLKNPAVNLTGPYNVPSAWGVPTINTLIFLISSLTITLGLRALKRKDQAGAVSALAATLSLGTVFLALQAHYYVTQISQLGITFTSGIYSTLFLALVGLHALHVLAGLILLTVILVRCIKRHFTFDNYFGYAATVWFWNFLSAMWVLIFVCVYGF